MPPDEHAREVVHEFGGDALERVRLVGDALESRGIVVERNRRAEHRGCRLECIHLVERAKKGEDEIGVVHAVRDRCGKGGAQLGDEVLVGGRHMLPVYALAHWPLDGWMWRRVFRPDGTGAGLTSPRQGIGGPPWLQRRRKTRRPLGGR